MLTSSEGSNFQPKPTCHTVKEPETILAIPFQHRAGDGGEGRGRRRARSAGCRGALPAPAPTTGWPAPARAAIVKQMSWKAAQPPESGPVDLVRIEPEAGRFRFYRLALQPDLFGGCSLVREWGRIGRPGTVRVRTLATEDAAATALARALARRHRRGYRPRSNRRRADDDAAAPAAAER